MSTLAQLKEYDLDPGEHITITARFACHVVIDDIQDRVNIEVTGAAAYKRERAAALLAEADEIDAATR